MEYNLSGSAGSYYLQFDFSDYKSFNKALYAISGNKKSFFTPGYFKISHSKFKKLNFSPYIKKYLEQEQLEFPSPMITELIYFKSVVHTPDDIRRIHPVSTASKVDERKSVQRFKISSIIENEVNTGIKIRY